MNLKDIKLKQVGQLFKVTTTASPYSPGGEILVIARDFSRVEYMVKNSFKTEIEIESISVLDKPVIIDKELFE